MAIKFQYNKTSLNDLGKQLKVRQKALPTLQNKESALRLEVRKAKDESDRLIADLEAALAKYDYLAALWNEFDPGLVAITDVDLHTVKVAGVKTPGLGEIHYEIRPFNAFVKPAWYADGVAILKGSPGSASSRRSIRRRPASSTTSGRRPPRRSICTRKCRFRATRKPSARSSGTWKTRKNLSKASQKIVKQRHAAEEEEASEV
jgi:ATP synthase subunit D.